ncbi:MAG: L,D-transpeptidase family protein [bacterium]
MRTGPAIRIAAVLTGLAVSAAALVAPAAAAGNPHRPETPANQSSLKLPMDLKDKGEYVRKTQRRLIWLGYDIDWREQLEGVYGDSTKEAVRQLQNKFYLPETGVVNKETWKTLDKVGSDVGELPKTCLSEAKTLCIDKTSKLLRYVRDKKVVLTLDVRFGVPGLETPNGTFRVWYKWRDATSGLSNPRAPMPFALFFAGDIAVHYSPPFDANGYYPGGGSHGCVNVRDRNGMEWLFDQFPENGLVHVYNG